MEEITREPDGDAFDWMAPPCLVVMVGAAGAGKSTWSEARWPQTRALSSDAFRELLTDDERSQWANAHVFELLESAARARLALGRRVVIDATNAKKEDRAQWLKLARELDVPCGAIWFDLSEEECMRRQEGRERFVSARVVARQLEDLSHVREELLEEGWDEIARVRGDHVPGESERLKSWRAPFSREAGVAGVRLGAKAADIIGDVHGCYDELMAMMEKLGWEREPESGLHLSPTDRLLVFVGDLVDRGPASVPVLDYAERMIEAGRAILVRGNHDDKLSRYLKGNKVKVDEHLQTTVDELDAMDEHARSALTERSIAMIDSSPMWALLGSTPEARAGMEAEVVVAHAAWRPSLTQSKLDKVRWFCLYGPTTGKKDENGYPERVDWKERYPRSGPLCVTGHTPFTGEVVERHNTMCLDTACVFGERLTALRWPEMELVEVAAASTYTEANGRVSEQPNLVKDPRARR